MSSVLVETVKAWEEDTEIQEGAYRFTGHGKHSFFTENELAIKGTSDNSVLKDESEAQEELDHKSAAEAITFLVFTGSFCCGMCGFMWCCAACFGCYYRLHS